MKDRGVDSSGTDVGSKRLCAGFDGLDDSDGGSKM
jgi:hypothetical protein